MKLLCFALILSQNSVEENLPPLHIQDLLKKRVLYQIKQQNPERQFFFDASTCNVIGTYDYIDDALSIRTHDKSIELQLAYTDILNGKKLELSALSQYVDSKENIVALATNQENLFSPPNENFSATSNSGLKKWLPWIIVGAVGLTLGGYAIYSSNRDSGGSRSGGSAPPSRRPR